MDSWKKSCNYKQEKDAKDCFSLIFVSFGYRYFK